MKPSVEQPVEKKRSYETPRLVTHGDVAKLTQKPWTPKDHQRFSGSDICIG